MASVSSGSGGVVGGLLSGGVEVGVVLSGASAGIVPVMLRRDRELEVREEDLALIVDPRVPGYYLLGVVRWVTRYEPFLRRSVHNVYAEQPDALDHELVMPFTNAYVEVYAGVCDGGEYCGGGRGLEANTYAPTPGSRVFKLRDGSPLSGYLSLGEPVSVGVHKYSGWRLPLDTGWVPYHIGVFGATGTGKSRLVTKLALELAGRGFSLIVFDHSGVDYVPRAESLGARVVRSSEIRINPVIFASTLSRYLGLSSYQRDLVEIVAMCYALRVYGREPGECRDLFEPPWQRRGRRGSGSLLSYAGSHRGEEGGEEEGVGGVREEFLGLLESAARGFNMKDATIAKIKLLTSLAVPGHVFERLPGRRLEPRELVSMALSEGVLVIDMSDEQDIEVKRAIVASVAEAAWEVVRERGRVNLGLVVDEAQNYACEYCGESGRALETVAREGRKWGLFLVVASQRVARDIRPGVRSNLGTVFFSRLQSTGDLQELSGYLDLGRLSESSLAMLGRQEFYVAGLMNPLRRPLLLRIDNV